MEIFNLTVFFELYGLSASLIAICASILMLIIEKFIPKDCAFKKIKGILLFSLPCVINYFYNAIFVLGYISFDYETISSTFICGSISLAVYSLINGIINGKAGKIVKTTYVLERLLTDFIPTENLSATAIAISALLDGVNKNPIEKENIFAIKEIIKNNVKGANEKEVDDIVNKIVEQINTPKI